MSVTSTSVRTGKALGAKVKDFLSNGGYATWFQTLIVLGTLVIAYWTLRDNDFIEGKKNTLELMRGYYAEEQAPAMALVRLENAQLDVMGAARESLHAYDSSMDADNGLLVKTARPLIKERIKGDQALQVDYETMRKVFYSMATCIDTGACDKDFAGRMFGPVIWRFFNATCPYMEEISANLQHANDYTKVHFFLENIAHITDQKYYVCR
jgi:hypothetical protein